MKLAIVLDSGEMFTFLDDLEQYDLTKQMPADAVIMDIIAELKRIAEHETDLGCCECVAPGGVTDANCECDHHMLEDARTDARTQGLRDESNEGRISSNPDTKF
ncbi:hypothetical protein LCGC14_2074210, partial [marine sediment metagenome]